MKSRRNRTRRRGEFDQLEVRQLLTLTMVPRLNITATQASNFSGVVAGLADFSLNASPSDFNNPPGSVQINWGDGQTSPPEPWLAPSVRPVRSRSRGLTHTRCLELSP